MAEKGKGGRTFRLCRQRTNQKRGREENFHESGTEGSEVEVEKASKNVGGKGMQPNGGVGVAAQKVKGQKSGLTNILLHLSCEI